MLRRAEGNVFWPGLKRDLQKYRDECSHCQENFPQQQRQAMMSIDVPSAPGLAVASDYFQTKGEEYVLFVDVFSMWTKYFRVHLRRPETLISKIKSFMSRNGVPRVLYSDKGSAYDSYQFREFCDEWGIQLITCSGEYPQGNGTAEAAVKRVKKWILSAENESDLTRAILAWHQTPISTGRPTPAQLHLGQNVRDEVQTRVEPCSISWDDVRLWRTAVKKANAQTYDRKSRELPELPVGEKVFVLVHGKWRRAVIEQKANRPRSYVLKMNDTGNRIERNRVHIRIDKTKKIESDNALFFFAGGRQEQNEPEQEQQLSRRPSFAPTPPRTSALSTPPRLSSSRGIRTCGGNEDESEDEEFEDAESDQPEEPVPRQEEPIPSPISSTRKPGRFKDREKLFLDKNHVSRVGRISKKVVPFDPSR
jgi:hypothetical protein